MMSIEFCGMSLPRRDAGPEPMERTDSNPLEGSGVYRFSGSVRAVWSVWVYSNLYVFKQVGFSFSIISCTEAVRTDGWIDGSWSH